MNPSHSEEMQLQRLNINVQMIYDDGNYGFGIVTFSMCLLLNK